MAWKQQTITRGEKLDPLLQALYRATTASADERPVDDGIALLVRDLDRKRAILLLSPAAAELAADLPGRWSDIAPQEIEGERWGLLYSSGVAVEDLGLKARNPGAKQRAETQNLASAFPPAAPGS